MSERFVIFASSKDEPLTCCDPLGTVVFQTQIDFTLVCLATSQDYIVVGGGQGIFGHDNCLLTILSLVGGVKKCTVPLASRPECVEFDPKGERFSCGLFSRTVSIFAFNEDNDEIIERKQFSVPSIVSSLVWINDDTICVGCFNGSVSTWDVTTGSMMQTLQDPAGIAVLTVYFLSTWDLILIGDLAASICKLKFDSGALIGKYKAHSYGLRGICITDDHTTIITCSTDMTVAAFDMVSFEEKWRYKCKHQATSITRICDEIFVGVCNSPVIVLDVLTGQLVRQFQQENYGWVHVCASQASTLAKLQFID